LWISPGHDPGAIPEGAPSPAGGGPEIEDKRQRVKPPLAVTVFVVGFLKVRIDMERFPRPKCRWTFSKHIFARKVNSGFWRTASRFAVETKHLPYRQVLRRR
jgi:hypothetical protein